MRRMPVLRFLTSIFALVAVVALVADATPALNSDAPFKMTTLAGDWQLLAPASLAAARTAVVGATAPWVWDTAIVSLLDLPTPVLFGLLAVLCGILGRRREEMKLHIN
jgi:hypothetical protein